MSVLRAVIVDDEPLTRERVRSLVQETEGLELVGEGRHGLEGLDLITALEPDVVFIDIEMPELDGFGVIAALDVEKTPAVVFITAYEHYALQAFDVGAADYLLKPVTRTRFVAAVERARVRAARRSPAQWREVVQEATVARRGRGPRSRFVVRRGNTHHFVPVEQVDWIGVADNYLELHVGGRAHLARGTMKQAEDELDAARFVRVHRSAIVAIDRIASIRALESGTFTIELRGGAQVRSSRQYAERVRELLRS